VQCYGEYGVLVVEPGEEEQEQQQFCIIHYPRLSNISIDEQTATRWPLAILKVRQERTVQTIGTRVELVLRKEYFDCSQSDSHAVHYI
jgi:hypothetical protein